MAGETYETNDYIGRGTSYSSKSSSTLTGNTGKEVYNVVVVNSENGKTPNYDVYYNSGAVVRYIGKENLDGKFVEDPNVELVEDSNVEEVPPEELVKGVNSDEGQNVKLVDNPEDPSKNNTTGDTFNEDMAHQAAFHLFPNQNEVSLDGLNSGFDDGGGFF